MKILALSLALAVGGCTFSNENGKCISPFEEGKPGVQYEISTRNTIWSALFLESVFAPALWILKCGKCPVVNEGK